MRITKQESRILLAGILYCKEQGMNDDWMEGYLIEQIELLSKFHRHDVIGSSDKVIPPPPSPPSSRFLKRR